MVSLVFLKTLDQVADFLNSVGSAKFPMPSKDAGYQAIAHVLWHFRYQGLRRPEKAR